MWHSHLYFSMGPPPNCYWGFRENCSWSCSEGRPVRRPNSRETHTFSSLLGISMTQCHFDMMIDDTMTQCWKAFSGDWQEDWGAGAQLQRKSHHYLLIRNKHNDTMTNWHYDMMIDEAMTQCWEAFSCDWQEEWGAEAKVMEGQVRTIKVMDGLFPSLDWHFRWDKY